MDAPAGDMNPFIGITDVEAAANDGPVFSRYLTWVNDHSDDEI